uniref:Uncharacterized protein n=1 Tax=Panagrolaimus davidi TaxID=227884 RepID=A0A914QT10_9BILA
MMDDFVYEFYFTSIKKNILKCQKRKCLKTVPCSYENREFLVDDPIAEHANCQTPMKDFLREQFKRVYLLKVAAGMLTSKNKEELKTEYEAQFKVAFPKDTVVEMKSMGQRIDRAVSTEMKADAINKIDKKFLFESSSTKKSVPQANIMPQVEMESREERNIMPQVEMESREERNIMPQVEMESREERNIMPQVEMESREEKDETNEIENDEDDEAEQTELEKSLGHLQIGKISF